MLHHFKCIYSVPALHYHSQQHSISQQNVTAIMDNEKRISEFLNKQDFAGRNRMLSPLHYAFLIHFLINLK